jgi:hypothetical protein
MRWCTWGGCQLQAGVSDLVCCTAGRRGGWCARTVANYAGGWCARTVANYAGGWCARTVANYAGGWCARTVTTYAVGWSLAPTVLLTARAEQHRAG